VRLLRRRRCRRLRRPVPVGGDGDVGACGPTRSLLQGAELCGTTDNEEDHARERVCSEREGEKGERESWGGGEANKRGNNAATSGPFFASTFFDIRKMAGAAWVAGQSRLLDLR
jgi:hypothetical protein